VVAEQSNVLERAKMASLGKMVAHWLKKSSLSNAMINHAHSLTTGAPGVNVQSHVKAVLGVENEHAKMAPLVRLDVTKRPSNLERAMR
jgi:hypothetical protein